MTRRSKFKQFTIGELLHKSNSLKIKIGKWNKEKREHRTLLNHFKLILGNHSILFPMIMPVWIFETRDYDMSVLKTQNRRVKVVVIWSPVGKEMDKYAFLVLFPLILIIKGLAFCKSSTLIEKRDVFVFQKSQYRDHFLVLKGIS